MDSLEMKHQVIANSPYPKVELVKLPKEVCDILLSDAKDIDNCTSLVSGFYQYEGRNIQIDNSYQIRKYFCTSPVFLKPLAPNKKRLSDDSGISISDDSDSSRDDNGNRRIQRWKEADERGEYEVEKIVDHMFSEKDRDLFRVKWVGWGDQFNTWEPLHNLNCEDVIVTYLKKKIHEALSGQRKAMPHCKAYMRVACRAIIDQWVKTAPNYAIKKKMQDGFNQKPVPISTLQEMLVEAVNCCGTKKSENLVIMIKDSCAIMRLKELRKEQLARLKMWETDMNSKGPGGLSVENNVDLEGPPEGFEYITQNRAGSEIDDAIAAQMGCCAGCECTEGCGIKKTCCPNMAGVDWAYSPRGRLIVSPRSGIFECNRFCVCDKSCPNRVVQRGRKVKLSIFRTANGRGWGVKACESIKKGTFLTTYLGEIISSDEAARRDEIYEKTGLSYLFDLDFMDPEEVPMYTVDAMHAGNESHFINHSCNPNAHVAGVWIESADPAVPILALFARKDIPRGEEITFNYQGDQDQRNNDETKIEMSLTGDGEVKTCGRRKAKKCKCGSRVCKGYYF